MAAGDTTLRTRLTAEDAGASTAIERVGTAAQGAAGDLDRMTSAGDAGSFLSSARNMEDGARRVGAAADEGAGGLDRLGGAADRGEGAAQGFADVIGGTTGILGALRDDSLSTTDQLIALGGGAADLSGGLSSFLIPAMQGLSSGMLTSAASTARATATSVAHKVASVAGAAATGAATAAQWLLNAALSANPIGLVILAIAAIVAALVLFFTKTEAGRKIWDAAMTAMRVGFQAFRTAAAAVFSWLTGAWNTLTSTLTSAPGRISGALSRMFDGLKTGFRSAINFVISGWNRLRFTVPSISFMGVTTPGFSVGVPSIQMLAQGGIITQPTLAVVGEGGGPEAVIPLDRADEFGIGGGQGVTVVVNVGAVGSEDFLARTVRDAVQRVQNRGYGYGYGPA